MSPQTSNSFIQGFVPSYLLGVAIFLLLFAGFRYVRRFIHLVRHASDTLSVLGEPYLTKHLRQTTKPVFRIFQVVMLWNILSSSRDHLLNSHLHKAKNGAAKRGLRVDSSDPVENRGNDAASEEANRNPNDDGFRIHLQSNDSDEPCRRGRQSFRTGAERHWLGRLDRPFH
jgi:hypothetical protein